MNLLKLWEKIGNQNLKHSKNQKAYVFIDGKKLEITNLVYENGKLVGFSTDNSKIWNKEEYKPKENAWVVVKDKDGKEYYNHQWTGHTWYNFCINSDGTCDGWRSDVDIKEWRYQTKKETT